jgi:2-polyprenyl-6-methoxyphenol hydroxylase-like FAD-dependent oxidoreductase
MLELGTVLIVGAGPAGMMAAIELARFGVPVRLIEKKDKPETTSRAVGVQARTLELFEQRGFADELIAKGNKGLGASSYDAGKCVFRLDFENTDSKYHYILFVSQAETERVLREALERAQVAIEWNTRMTAFVQSDNPGSVTATIQKPDGAAEQFSCAYMIDTEGAHSIARPTLGLEFRGKTFDENYALGDLYVDGDIADSDLHTFSSSHGFMGLFPMGNRRFRLIASNPLNQPSRDTQPSLEELQQIYDQRSHIPVKFRDLSWSSWFRINSRRVEKMQAGHIFLGGDSAHIHSPAGAQGMNTGLQDMVNLGWKLAMVMRGEAKPALLETYSEDRVPVIKNVLEKTEDLTKVVGSENPVVRELFDHLGPWLVETQFVQKNSTERMSQLAVGYRDSPLSESHGHSGSLRAGDRLPDLAITVLNREGSPDIDPHAGTIFGLLDPSKFTILYSHISEVPKTHATTHGMIGPWTYLSSAHLIAPSDTDRAGYDRLLGKSSLIILVRPDGYIAFTGHENSIPALQKYCDRWLVGRAPIPDKKLA